jgi:hypothetical protein
MLKLLLLCWHSSAERIREAETPPADAAIGCMVAAAAAVTSSHEKCAGVCRNPAW